MAIRDEDFSADLAVEGDDGIWSPSAAVSSSVSLDFRSLYRQARARADRERARADAAEARAEELLRAEQTSRSDAGSWKWRFKACRSRLTAVEAEVKEQRRAAKDVPSLQAEIAGLKTLLSEAGISLSADGVIASLRTEVARLRKALAASEAGKSAPGRRPGKARGVGSASKVTQQQKEKIKSLRAECGGLRRDVTRLNKKLEQETQRAEGLKATGKKLSGEVIELHAELRRRRDQTDLVCSLTDEVFWLRHSVKGADAREETLRARVARVLGVSRAHKEALSAADADLRKALRRSRRQKAAIKSLTRENARLRKAAKTSQARIGALKARVSKLRASRAALSRRLFGRKSEKQEKSSTGRERGQQRGAPGHGRTQRPNLKERKEEKTPPRDALICSCCGEPYAPNGAEETTIVEIEVKAHKRRIVRPRWRRACECASSPREVIAPPVPRLFDRTPYGTSVWAHYLYERYACFRPLKRVAAWMSDQGLLISPGTLASSVERFIPVFEPVAGAILDHQNQQTVRHGDETSWRIQSLREIGRSSRAWLWNSVSEDAVYFHSDPSRSAEVAKTLFGETVVIVFVVCDRFSSYKKMARDLDGKVILCFCWVHQRRDFIDCAAGHNRLTEWCQSWIERIASIYSLNKARLEHYDPALERQTPEFDAAQGELQKAVDKLFADAEAELAGLSDGSREAKPLRSLLNHREGLSVFVDNPQVPMDNNFAERAFRGAVIGRRLSFGSDSEDGAKFTAMMYSVVGTLAMNGIDVRRWLEAWLKACAKNGGKPPDDLSPWLPWSMSGARRRKFTAPG